MPIHAGRPGARKVVPATALGIDLAGPGNAGDTAWLALRAVAGRPRHAAHGLGADDAQLLRLVADAARTGRAVVGLDAPLSYEPGGGLRRSDRSLRQKLVEAGLRPGTVMPPTLTRMVYLTVRGIALSRALAQGDLAKRVTVVEVHPAGALALAGAPVADVREIKRSADARRRVVRWLARHVIAGLPDELAESDHLVAACGAALATWRWRRGESAWCWPAEPPLHPCDFAC